MSLENNRRAQAVAQKFAENAHVLDVAKRFSYGKNQDTLNMIDEHAKAIQLNWVFSNKTATRKTIVLSPFFDGVSNPTQFTTLAEVLAATKADVILKNGTIAGTSDAILTAASTDEEKPLDQFLRYISQNPTRLTGVSFVSRDATTGAKDASNFDLKIRSIWVSPFDLPTVKDQNLRPLVAGGANFNTDRLFVNFIEQAFPAVLSNEHFLTMQINPNTELSVTLYVGAQKSKSQSFWRDVKKADDVLRPGIAQIV